MKQELAIKVYEVDYSFIIKNYLDPQLWQKDKFEWLKENYLRKHADKNNLITEIEEKIAEMETDEYQEELEDGLESIM